MDDVENPKLPDEFIERIIGLEIHPDITDEEIENLADDIILEALQHEVFLTCVDQYLYEKRNESMRLRRRGR
tara:strand:+ start:11737 stop:11952 length:216 start_codon:yes stop_codon:yes gene_type:complete